MSRTVTAALALGLLLAAGCGGDATRATDPDRPRGAADVETSRSPSATRSAPATPQARASRRVVASGTPAPTPSGNALTIRKVGPAGDHLLAAHDLGSSWRITDTAPENGRLTSRCQQASLHDIGALATQVRKFAAPGASAGQAVSEFADPKSAWRSEQVVIAWRDDCAEQLRQRGAALGAVRHGAWLSVVEVEGVDEPRRALRAALRKVRDSFEA